MEHDKTLFFAYRVSYMYPTKATLVAVNMT